MAKATSLARIGQEGRDLNVAKATNHARIDREGRGQKDRVAIAHEQPGQAAAPAGVALGLASHVALFLGLSPSLTAARNGRENQAAA